ncbi:MAG: protein DA1 [Melioribacter sp.]|nr:protein DA1 [Melioribacter sp.]
MIKLFKIISSNYQLKSFIIILFLIAQSQNFAQNKIRCVYCQQEVNNKYILVDGKAYHPEHFLCKECNRPINGNFVRKDGSYYHPDCYIIAERLICDYCKKALNEEYVVNENKKYHKSCYENYILPKCAVCSMPLKGEYYEDIYQNKYHPYHRNELHQCDCCNRIICQSITNGGQDYSDGRHICNKCYATAVFDPKQLAKLLTKVSERLSSIGIKFNLKNIKIVGLDRNVLRNKAKDYNENTQGYCDSKSLNKYIDDKLVAQTTYHNIYVLNGMSSIVTESIIAHELMHSWIYENTKNNFSQKINEGSCNYASYLYLKSLNQNSALEQIKLLETDPDAIYGKGFFEIRQRFENKSVYDFLTFLRY